MLHLLPLLLARIRCVPRAQGSPVHFQELGLHSTEPTMVAIPVTRRSSTHQDWESSFPFPCLVRPEWLFLCLGEHANFLAVSPAEAAVLHTIPLKFTITPTPPRLWPLWLYETFQTKLALVRLQGGKWSHLQVCEALISQVAFQWQIYTCKCGCHWNVITPEAGDPLSVSEDARVLRLAGILSSALN